MSRALPSRLAAFPRTECSSPFRRSFSNVLIRPAVRLRANSSAPISSVGSQSTLFMRTNSTTTPHTTHTHHHHNKHHNSHGNVADQASSLATSSPVLGTPKETLHNVVFYLNGKRCAPKEVEPDLTLIDYLRSQVTSPPPKQQTQQILLSSC